jgi:8-amino-7-oxononanoate synthase
MQSWNEWFDNQHNCLSQSRIRRSKIQYDQRFFIDNNSSYLNLISNDYLDLANHLALTTALNQASNIFGVGSTGAPTLSGYTIEHKKLSINMASWLGFDKCLLFNSGYQLNVGLYNQLVDKDTIIWLDKNYHASHIDGILLSGARFNTFTPYTLDNTILKIKHKPNSRHIIVTEGSFSMDGTCTYLASLIHLKSESPENILLIIDDAHGIGALGQNGFGTLEQLGLSYQHVDLLIGTFSKAFASHGGFICGAKYMIEYLTQTVRSQIFSTYLPACIAAASNASLAVITSIEGQQLRNKLANNISQFQLTGKKYNLPVANLPCNISPIQVLIFNNETQVKYLSQQLLDNGILAGNIFHPTVKKSEPRIRISLTSSITNTDIEAICYTLYKHIV